MRRLALFVNPDSLLTNHGGTLLSAARRALDITREMPEATIIPASGRTLGEINGVWPYPRGPRIAESGAVLELPGEGADVERRLLGPDREEIRRHLSALRARYGWRFHISDELSNEALAKILDVSLLGAAQAKDRQASELVLWDDGPQARIEFRAALRHRGLQVPEGDGIAQVTGETDKGAAMAEVMARLRGDPTDWQVAVIGSGPSDGPMVEAADFAVMLHADSASAPSSEGVVSLTLDTAGWKEAGQRLRRWWQDSA